MAIYVIPTGSMQPTLHGKGDYPHERGDKVLVNKFVYRFTEPKKWDVIVFKYPHKIIQCSKCERDIMQRIPQTEPEVIPEGLACATHGKKYLKFIEKDYIKRCVATEGDVVSVRDGNILLKKDGEWTFSQKTDEAQAELWRNVYSLENLSLETNPYFWRWGSISKGKWNEEEKTLNLSEEKQYHLVFAHQEHLQGYGDKGIYNDQLKLQIERPIVGDTQIAIEMKSFPAKGLLELKFQWNMIDFTAELNFAEKKCKIKQAGELLKEIKLNASELRYAFSRLDGFLHFHHGIEGSIKVKIKNVNAEMPTHSIFPSVKYKGDALVLTDLDVNRDIYYDIGESREFFSGQDLSYTVQPGECFAMGDNSYHSSDSRMWGPVPEDVLIGKALVVLWPLGRTKLIY